MEDRKDRGCKSGQPSREEIDQALVRRHTREVQEKLSRASVAVAGLGGLGSNIAVCLARIGVGHLHLWISTGWT